MGRQTGTHADGRHTRRVHMVEPAHSFWERHLLFRDYMRKHPNVAAQYGRLKRVLADRFGTDREGCCSVSDEMKGGDALHGSEE